jgi:hypothetical protein
LRSSFFPHHIAANAEERERFKIEAKAAAALNHSNIATIYAIEEAPPQNDTVETNTAMKFTITVKE